MQICYGFSARAVGELYPKAKLDQISCRATRDQWSIAQNLTVYSNPDELSIKHAQKVMDVRHLLGAGGEDPFTGLIIVDAVQRLGIDYHFQEEIEAEMWKLHMSTGDCIYESQSLQKVSLYFRLLRQEGYHVPADVFKNFTDEEGRFKPTLSKDVQALMGLYEAAQLSIEGEHILDEAANFSSLLLNEWLRDVDDDKAGVIASTLRYPCHKSLSRIKAKNFVNEFKDINGWEKNLQELFYMEFFVAQRIYKQELLQVFKWWKDLGLARELKHARDQPLKWFTWPMATLTDLGLSDERIELTKAISFIYIIDDIFDLYGKPDELVLFTEAMNRWELSAIEQLPDYMKKCFRALYDITNEICCKIQNKHGFNPTESLRKSWATLCNAFLVESKWFASKDLPKADEYLKNGAVSSGVHVVLVHMFFLLGLGATEESGINLDDSSGIITSVAKILRLWDDLGSAKDEDQDGHDGSYIDCYMKEHQGVSTQFARDHVFNLISDEWKNLNKECLRLSRFLAPFKKASLNLARMVPLMYDYDNHRLPALEEYIKSMLYNDSPLQPETNRLNGSDYLF